MNSKRKQSLVPKQKSRPSKKHKGKKRAAKDWIRGPLLEVLVKNPDGVTMEDAILRAKAEKRVMASNKRLDQAMEDPEEKNNISSALWCWAGTMTAYERAGEPFGKVVEFLDQRTGLRYLFEVPKRFRGKKDCILVAEHPDYSYKIQANTRIIRAAKLDLIENFPSINGKYATDPKYGIPFGDPVNQSVESARTLNRRELRIGLAARFRVFDEKDHGVSIYERYYSTLGMIVETPIGCIASCFKQF